MRQKNMNFKMMATVAALVVAMGSASAAVKDFTVNGVKITAAEQEQMIKAAVRQGQKRSAQLEELVKRSLTARAAVYAEAAKSGVEKNPQVASAIENARKQILSEAFLADYLKKNPVSDADVKAIYDRQKGVYGKTEYHLNHIAVKTQEDAQKAAERLKKGEAFAKVARSVSVDPAVARNGGDMGWVNSGTLPPQMVEGLNGIKGSQTIIVPGPAGFEVVQNKGSRNAKPFPSYNAAKAEIRRGLEARKVDQYAQQLTQKAEVK